MEDCLRTLWRVRGETDGGKAKNLGGSVGWTAETGMIGLAAPCDRASRFGYPWSSTALLSSRYFTTFFMLESDMGVRLVSCLMSL